MKLSILIPVYNEKNTILEILKRIDAVDLSKQNCEKEIILIDDFSTDGTREILKRIEEGHGYQRNSTESGLLYADLTYKIRGAVFEVWKQLGPVFKESIYQKALEKEFAKRNIPYDSQKDIQIKYDNEKIGVYRPDFIVDNKVIVEIKKLPCLSKNEVYQTKYYLSGSEYRLALLINFGGRKLQIERYILDNNISGDPSNLQKSADINGITQKPGQIVPGSSVNIGSNRSKNNISGDPSDICGNQSEIKVLYHEKNRGKGYALRTGIKHATGDIIIVQDADLEYDPQDYAKLIAPIISGKEKVVYGSRILGRNAKSSLSFYLGGRFLSVLANVLYGIHITDEATCYKVFKADVLKNIDLKCERFEFCPEVTAKVAKQGINILDVPIKYYPRSIEEGKKINWRDGLEAIWTLIKYRFTR